MGPTSSSSLPNISFLEEQQICFEEQSIFEEQSFIAASGSATLSESLVAVERGVPGRENVDEDVKDYRRFSERSRKKTHFFGVNQPKRSGGGLGGKQGGYGHCVGRGAAGGQASGRAATGEHSSSYQSSTTYVCFCCMAILVRFGKLVGCL